MTTELFQGMSEADFLHAYEATALRKPQVVSDNVLTGILLADASYRVALAALLLQEAVEAARRLAGVWAALSDRSWPVARRLADPLPGADAWHDFVESVAAMAGPSELLRRMAIDASALRSAEELLTFPGLQRFEAPIRVFESGPPVAFVMPEDPSALVVRNAAADGSHVEARWSLARDDVTSLGDATGYFVTWSRDFLGAYIEARAVQADP